MVFSQLYNTLLALKETPKLLSAGLWVYTQAEVSESLGADSMLVVVNGDIDSSNKELEELFTAQQQEMEYQTRKESKAAVDYGVFASGILDELADRVDVVVKEYLSGWGSVSLKAEVNESTLPRVTLLIMQMALLLDESIKELARIATSEEIPYTFRRLVLHTKNSLSDLLTTVSRQQTEVICNSSGGDCVER